MELLLGVRLRRPRRPGGPVAAAPRSASLLPSSSSKLPAMMLVLCSSIGPRSLPNQSGACGSPFSALVLLVISIPLIRGGDPPGSSPPPPDDGGVRNPRSTSAHTSGAGRRARCGLSTRTEWEASSSTGSVMATSKSSKASE